MGTTLTAEYGKLRGPAGPLLVVHPEGDCDSIAWPHPNWAHLISALFDEGNIETSFEYGPIYLPDGRLVGELVRCGFNPTPEIEALATAQLY